MTHLLAGLIGFAFGWILRNYIDAQRNGGPLMHHVGRLDSGWKKFTSLWSRAWHWIKDKILIIFLVVIFITQLIAAHDRREEKKDFATAQQKFDCTAQLFLTTIVALNDRGVQTKSEANASDKLNTAEYNFLITLTKAKATRKQRTEAFYAYLNALSKHNKAREKVKTAQTDRPFPTEQEVKECLSG